MNLRGLADTVPTPEDVAWYDIIGKFKAYAAKFQQDYQTLQNTGVNAAKYPELARQQLDLLKSGAAIKQKIVEVTSAIDGAWNWLKSTFGFEGLRDVGQINGLGLVPLIPIAVVTAAIAAITKWALDYVEFYQKLNYSRELEAKGYAATQVNEMVSATGKKSWFDFGNIAPVAVLGIGAAALMYYLSRNRG